MQTRREFDGFPPRYALLSHNPAILLIPITGQQVGNEACHIIDIDSIIAINVSNIIISRITRQEDVNEFSDI